ncbi:MAG: hypothetical protein L6V87_10550 [Ruminococcus sp.]|nr:MAG: hypothetical protein L6V87_10550 [Ruminococcus sp.]
MKIDADLSAAKLASPEAADAQVSEYKAALEEMKSAHAAADAEKKSVPMKPFPQEACCLKNLPSLINLKSLFRC